MRWLLALGLLGGCGNPTCLALDVDCFLSQLAIVQDNADVPVQQLSNDSLLRVLGTRSNPQPSTPPPDLSVRPVQPSGPGPLLGCFVDRDSARDLDGPATFLSNNSPDSCNAQCAGYAYFGLQDTNWCYCGNAYGKYGLAPSSDCYMTCPILTTGACGGFLRNSIYTTGSSASSLDMSIASSPRDMAMSGGGGGGAAPSATVNVPSISVTVGHPEPVDVTFSDPGNACTPTFCFSLCNRNLRCSSHSVCTHTLRDGLRSGVWRSALGVKAEPGDARTTDLTIVMKPISTGDCSDVPALVSDQERNGFQPISGAEQPIAGGDVKLPMTVTASSSSSSSTGGGTVNCVVPGYTIRGPNGACCSQPQSCCTGSFQACVWTDSVGNCVKSGYVYQNLEYSCSGCNNTSCVQGQANVIITSCCPKP
jgi:hypothetical protein